MTPDLSRISKILIIQYQPFGDVLLNTGYLPALRDKFPDARIDYLVREPYHKALLGNPFLDNLLTFKDEKGWQYFSKRFETIMEIRSRNYDLVIDQIRNSASAFFTVLSGARYRLGFAHQRWHSFYNLKAERKSLRYYSAMKFDVLAPLGINEEPHSLYFKIEESSQKYIDKWLEQQGLNNSKLICFSPGSPVKSKKWDLQNYARLGDKIAGLSDYKILVIWGPGEQEDADQVIAYMNQPALKTPQTSFNQAAALLTKCQLLVCNDGGINHLSVATETPSIAIFGQHKPIRWSPVIFKNHFHFYKEGVDYKNDRTLGISVDEVLQKVRDILKF